MFVGEYSILYSVTPKDLTSDLIDSAILLNCRQHNSHLRARRDSHHGSRSPPRRRMQSVTCLRDGLNSGCA